MSCASPVGTFLFHAAQTPPSLCKRPKATSWILRLWFLMPNSHLKNAFAPSKLGTHTTTKNPAHPQRQPSPWKHQQTSRPAADGRTPPPAARAEFDHDPRQKRQCESSREKAPMRMLHFAYAVADGGGLRINYVINTLVGSRWVLSLLRHDAKLY